TRFDLDPRADHDPGVEVDVDDLLFADDGDRDLGPDGAVAILRRGLAASPELKVGIGFTLGMAVAAAIGRLVIPILVQQILDRGVLSDDGYRPGFVWAASAVALVVVVGVWIASRATYLRLMIAAENTLRSLRVRAFAHIHRLSIADHGETKRGILVARVTSDIETIARFAQWGAVAWIVNSVILLGTFVV